MRIMLESKWKRFFLRKTIFRNMVTLALFAAMIPVLAVGISSYFFSASAVQSEVNQSNVRILNNVSANIDASLERIQNNAIQMLLGTFFSSNLTDLKNTNYTGFYSGISRELAALQSSNREVSDIAMYVPEEAYLISPLFGGQRIEGSQEREALQRELAADEQMKWMTGPYTSIPAYNTQGVTFISKAPILSNKPIGLLLIRIDASLFKSIMDRFVSYKGEQIFILNEHGVLVSSTGGDQVPPGLIGLAEQQGKNQRFAFTYQETEYMVTPIISSFNKWKYIDMVPVSQLNAKSKGIALITLGILAGCLVLGVSFALWGTRRVYQPIKHLVAQVKGGQTVELETDEVGFVRKRWLELSSTANQLQEQLSDQMPLMREIFALQLLQGRFVHYTGDQLEHMLHRYSVPSGREHHVLVIASDPQPDGEWRFQQEHDRELIAFAVKNITSDLLRSQELDGIVINLMNDQIAVWLFIDAETVIAHESRPDVKSFAERLRLLISDYLRFPVTIGLGGQSDRIAELPELYEEAALALRSRMIVGGNQVIAFAGGSSDADVHYRYPIEIEAHFEQSLQIGDRTEVERMLDEFANSMKDTVSKPEWIHMSYYRLLTSALRTAYALGLDNKQLFGEADADPYAQIRQIHTVVELNGWINDQLVKPIVVYVHGRQSQEHEQLIQKVVRYMEDNYHFDLSLDQCAQICGLSPHYLSKLFKKTMNVSFIEYLTKHRIDKSIELLRTTDQSVSEIAERVGYQTKNFIRVFKKHVGVTPGQFRGTESEM